jgi:hypothetical protein
MLIVESANNAYGARLLTQVALTKGQVIHQLTDYQHTPTPSYQSIQIDAHCHIEQLGIFAYLNHACQPNTIIDTTTLTLYAARTIAVGEELTFFYPSTEWEMQRPFICLCGAPQCVRLVAGAKYLSVDILGRYFINRHIRELILIALTQATIKQG